MTGTADISGDDGTLVVTHVDLDLVLDSLSAKQRARAGQSLITFLRTQTHLHLQSRGLEGFLAGSLHDIVPRATVAFLQDNKLTHVPAISQLRNLHMLYLQDNDLVSTADLRDLTSLRKLDLEGNALQSLTGLGALTNVTDLHVSRQRVPPGCSLEMDQDVVTALSANLTVLRAASCHLHSISCLGALVRLQIADFSDNELSNQDDFSFFVDSITCLQRLDVRGNPICHNVRLMDQAVLRGENLIELNGKQVKAQTRDYLRRIVKVRAHGGSAKCGKGAAEKGQAPNESNFEPASGMLRVEEARPHANNNVAQLRIPSPGGIAVSFNALKGLASPCTPPSSCTPEDLKASAWNRI